MYIFVERQSIRVKEIIAAFIIFHLTCAHYHASIIQSNLFPPFFSIRQRRLVDGKITPVSSPCFLACCMFWKGRRRRWRRRANTISFLLPSLSYACTLDLLLASVCLSVCTESYLLTTFPSLSFSLSLWNYFSASFPGLSLYFSLRVYECLSVLYNSAVRPDSITLKIWRMEKTEHCVNRQS